MAEGMNARSLDPQILNRWVGRQEVQEDILDARQARLMAATLGLARAPEPGDALPPLWHWIYFPVALPPDQLGRDGHPALGGFLPPVALPRRMWAGGRLRFDAPLRVGSTVRKTSTIGAVQVKQGRSGPLCFVTVVHELAIEGASCLREEHDIVYREDPHPDAAPPVPPAAPDGAETTRSFSAREVTLFRYSALTFNGHRIHYDRDYCRKVEGYPDLVVHGPLIATLLAAEAAAFRPDRSLRHFAYRARSPICGDAAFSLNARASEGGATLWAATGGGALAMEATAEFA